MAVTFAYTCAFILSLLALILTIYLTRDQQGGGIYVLFSAVVAIVNFGYMSLCLSTTAEEAILANKITYFDGTFLSLLIFMAVLKICKIRLKPVIFAIPIAISFSVFALACTTGYSDIYYKSVTLIRDNGFTFLEKEYGVAHTYYLVVLSLYMLGDVALIIYAAFHRKKVSYKYTIIMCFLVFITFGSYVVEGILDLKFELLPFMYVITEYMIVLMLHRISMYDVSINALKAKEKMYEYGYLILDNERRFVGCDETAAYYFPELENLNIDSPVNDSFVSANFVSWINTYQKDNTKIFERNGKIVRCQMRPFIKESDKSSKQIGYIVEIMDDTEQQNHIQLLNRFNDDLKEAVESAKKATLAKSQFLSNMSHEIRTPINAILGMTEMILRETSEDEVREYASDVMGSGHMLLALINDILDFSKIESGKMEILENPYFPKDIVDNLHSMIKVRADDKGIVFTSSINPVMPSQLQGDEVKIRQIATNLLTNAVKYTDEGEVKMHFDFEKVPGEDKKALLVITVSDTGRGISAEGQKHLFNSFVRVDEQKNKEIEGTGLGLAITKQFVDMMQGTITVESTYGQGSVFTVKIPQMILSDRTISDADAVVSRALESKTEAFTAPGARVMVVDDVEMNLKVFTRLVKAVNMQVDTAGSGEEAVEKAAATHYDLIFLDHMMPGMDGVECLSHIHGNLLSQNKETPVIMVTANVVAGVRDYYLELGFVDYLSKPFQGKELERMLLAYLPQELIEKKNINE